MQQSYDGDGLRVKRTENGTVTLYLRSSVLGGQVLAEMNGSGVWQRGYVYSGSNLLAVQSSGVSWVHEDPVTKSKRVTDINGTVVSTVELDPWGADTSRSSNAAFQPKKYTSYDRDGNASDEAMFRRYNRQHSRFDQPDPWDVSYSLADPQSFNRYAYTQNDPVNFTDPTGTMMSCDWLGSAQRGETVTYSVFRCYNKPGLNDWYEPKDPNVPDSTDPPPQKTEKMDDCWRFASEVDRIANEVFVNNNNSRPYASAA
jgi:RHS repeat-associated protein